LPRKRSMALIGCRAALAQDTPPQAASCISNLYDTDIALWSEHQAALLRRRRAG
jgi:hypothetical protein